MRALGAIWAKAWETSASLSTIVDLVTRGILGHLEPLPTTSWMRIIWKIPAHVPCSNMRARKYRCLNTVTRTRPQRCSNCCLPSITRSKITKRKARWIWMRLTLKLCLTKFQPGKKIPLQAPSRSPTIQGANLAVTEAEAIMCRTSWRRLFRALRSRFRRAQWAQLPRRRPTQSNSKGMMQIWATTRRDIRAHAATVTHPLPSRTKVQLVARQEIKCRTRLSRGLRYSFVHKS